MTASQEKAFLRHCQALGPGVRGSPRWKEIAERMAQKGKKVDVQKLMNAYRKDKPLGRDLRRLIKKWKWSEASDDAVHAAGLKKKLNFPDRRPKRRPAKKKQPKRAAKKPSSQKKKKK